MGAAEFHKWTRRILWAFAGLITVAVLAVGGGMLWLRHAMSASLPAVDGELHLAGLSTEVLVRRDGHGVPHIQANTMDDLLMAQGFVTAQDRLWQMDGLRRNASGELAEILGPSLVEHDKAQRVLQFREVAQRIYNSLPPVDRNRYEQYAKGVNLFIDQNRGHLAPEFRVLGYQPKPWTGLDSILIGLNMVDTLDSHWDVKLSRERIAADLHDPKLEADLYPVGSWRDQPPSAAVTDMTQPHPPPSTDDDDDNDQTQTQMRNRVPPPQLVIPEMAKTAAEDPHRLRAILGLPACDGCAPGSNNWVVAGTHTASGKPLLSNDMHLGLSVPNVWYMAALKAPGLDVAGVTLPGVPMVIAGHNEHIAWGFTALYADVQDLYVEKLDGKGNYAGSDGQWLPLAHSRQTIHVRFGKDVPLDVQLTAHGPLLNPILEHEQRPLALQWTLYDPALDSIPLYEMNTAANYQQFSLALAAWSWPTQNVVYSDDAGHIAYHAIGKVPIRPGGLISTPISAGDGGKHNWQGYIPFEELPNAFDPPSGILATANSRVTPNDTKFPLTLEWAEPYRAERVYMDLRGRDKLTPADMLAVQTDIYSEVDQELAHRFAYAIDQTVAHGAASDARLKQAADLMRSWDGRMTVDSPAASIILRTRQAFWPLILAGKLGRDWEIYEWSESNFAQEEIIMHGSSVGPNTSTATGQASPWLPAGFKDWDALLAEAVRKGLERGHAPADLTRWRYGSWHIVDLEHPVFGRMPLISSWFGTGEQPQSGDTTTIKQVGRAFGPSQRFTMDWSNPDGSTENIVLGESGDPASPWFRDQWPAWYEGATFALPFSADAVTSQTTHTLRLVP
jgi:penicillin G amidase